MMAEDRDTPKKHPKPTSYDQLYPGRFIKAPELLGKKVTLTITDVELEDLTGDDGTKTKALVRFKETPKMLVLCKTNGICVKEMFGKELANWVGKRITLFEDTWNGEPATRIWGSPDIAADTEVTIQLPRRRPFKKVLHKVGAANRSARLVDPIPHFDMAAAIAELRRAKTLADLEARRGVVWQDFADTKRALPIEVEDVYNMLKEQIGEAEGKEIEE